MGVLVIELLQNDAMYDTPICHALNSFFSVFSDNKITSLVLFMSDDPETNVEVDCETL